MKGGSDGGDNDSSGDDDGDDDNSDSQMISFCTNVSLFNWLTTLRGFLSPYPSKILLSHKGNGETDFLMSGQSFILTHAFTLLTHSIIHLLVPLSNC